MSMLPFQKAPCREDIFLAQTLNPRKVPEGREGDSKVAGYSEREVWQGILLSIRALVPVTCSQGPPTGRGVTASVGKCPSLEDLWRSCQCHREGLQGQEALPGSDLVVTALAGAGEWGGEMG